MQATNSHRDLVAYHNYTVRFLCERLGSKKTKAKKKSSRTFASSPSDLLPQAGGAEAPDAPPPPPPQPPKVDDSARALKNESVRAPNDDSAGVPKKDFAGAQKKDSAGAQKKDSARAPNNGSARAPNNDFARAPKDGAALAPVIEPEPAPRNDALPLGSFLVGSVTRCGKTKEEIDQQWDDVHFKLQILREAAEVLALQNSLESAARRPPADEDPSSVANRQIKAVQRYRYLSETVRPQVRNVLDGLPGVRDTKGLTDKVLLSIMVLSYRDCSARRNKLQGELDAALRLVRCSSSEPILAATTTTTITASLHADDIDKAFRCFLQTNADKYNYKPTVQDVIDKVNLVLYDYPCLRECKELQSYAEECARVAWDLCTVSHVATHCPWVNWDDVDFLETRYLRIQGSVMTGSKIDTCVWPSLLDGETGICLCKGLVITR